MDLKYSKKDMDIFVRTLGYAATIHLSNTGKVYTVEVLHYCPYSQNHEDNWNKKKNSLQFTDLVPSSVLFIR